jgi:hypothetical protein
LDDISYNLSPGRILCKITSFSPHCNKDPILTFFNSIYVLKTGLSAPKFIIKLKVTILHYYLFKLQEPKCRTMNYDYEYINRIINGTEITLIRSSQYQTLYNERLTMKKKHNVKKMAFAYIFMEGDKKLNITIGNEINDDAFLAQDFDLLNWKKESISL